MEFWLPEQRIDVSTGAPLVSNQERPAAVCFRACLVVKFIGNNLDLEELIYV